MKMFKKLLLLVILLIPFNCMALSYSFNEMRDGQDGKGNKFIYIKLSDIGEGVDKTDELECSVESVDVTCLIEPVEGYKIEMKRVMTESGELIKADGDIARIVLSNSTKAEVTTKVTLKYGVGTAEDPKEITADNVKIGKYAPLSTDSTLSELYLSTGIIFPEFKKDENNYTIYGIEDSIRRIQFTYKCDSCNVKFEGGTSTIGSTVYINNGENQVKAIVTSQDQNNTTTYNFTVIRGDTKFNSNKIKSLSLGSDYTITPTLASDVYEYSVTIPKKITNIENMLQIELEDSGATKTVEGANKVDKDDNEVKITIAARDGAKQEYILKVHREDTQEEIIEVIYYKDKKVAFINTENVREELTEDKFKEKYPTEYAKIQDKTYKFDADGNIIKNQEVTPTPQEEPKKEEETKKESNFPWLIVILIAVAIIIIVVAGIIIFKSPDDKKGEEDEDVKDPTPTKEELEKLEAIDTYNEEARLIAENNKLSQEDEITDVVEPVEFEDEVKTEPVADEETVVKTEEIGEYVDETNTPTMDIDEALSDLMNTKEYNFKDK